MLGVSVNEGATSPALPVLAPFDEQTTEFQNMTLAIGIKKESGFLLEADTFVEVDSRRSARKDHAIPGILKVFVINSEICFAFSGQRIQAFNALREINDLKHKTIQRVESILLESHRRTLGSVDETDYILCDAIADHMKKTLDGAFVGHGSKFLFVGNASAASALEGGGNDLVNLLSDKKKAYENVGGLVISAESVNGRFNYSTKAISAINIRPEPPRLFALLQTDDRLNYSTLVSKDRILPVLGVYFTEAKCGVLYDHLAEDEPSVHGGIEASEFASKLEGLYSSRFMGIMSVSFGAAKA